MRSCRSIGRDDEGASAAEYALVLALVALAALGAWAALGERTSERARCVADAIAQLGSGAPCGAGATTPGGGAPGGVSPDSDSDAIENALASLPRSVREMLERQGTEIVVTDRSVAGALPAALDGQRPRGWPPGTTFANVGAVYLPSEDRVVVARDALGSHLSEALAHEIGHAMDLGRARSGSDAFRGAYAATEWGAGDYDAQSGRAGLEEAYADSFAAYATDPDALRRSSPALYRYWRAHASDRLAARSGDLLAAAGAAPRPIDFGIGYVKDKAAGAVHALDTVADHTPLGAALEHGPALVERASRWAWNETPLDDGARATWSALPSDVQTFLETSAGFAYGVEEFARPLVELGLRYGPTPQGMINTVTTGATVASHPSETWAVARAMPSATVAHYRQLGHDFMSDDPFTAGRAAGMFSAEVASFFVPGGAVAGRTGSIARVATSAERYGFDHAGVAPLRVPPPLPSQHLLGRPLRDHGTGFCFAAGTPVHLGAGGTAPIERLHIGSRVRTLGADARAATSVDRTWRLVRLEMADPSGSGDLVDVDLLRPARWIEDLGAAPGGAIHLVLTEMGIEGAARIVSIEPPPAIEHGPGFVVLSTIASTSNRLMRVRFEDTDETLEATASHPLYSLDREAWVRVAELRAGERLRGASGAVRIASIDPIPGAHRVYNLEIETEHAFLVSGLGVLSHNNNPCATPGDFAEWARAARLPEIHTDPLPIELAESFGGDLHPLEDWIRSSPSWAEAFNARFESGWDVLPARQAKTEIDPASQLIYLGTEDPGADLARTLAMVEDFSADPVLGPEHFAAANDFATYAADRTLRMRAHSDLFVARVNEELAIRDATLIADWEATVNGLRWHGQADPIGAFADHIGDAPAPGGEMTARGWLEQKARRQWEEAEVEGTAGNMVGSRSIPIENRDSPVEVTVNDTTRAVGRGILVEQLTNELWQGAQALRARTWEFTPGDLEHAVDQVVDRAGLAELRFDQTHRIEGPNGEVGHRLLSEGTRSGISRGGYRLGVDDGRAVVRWWREDGEHLEHGVVPIRRHD